MCFFNAGIAMTRQVKIIRLHALIAPKILKMMRAFAKLILKKLDKKNREVNREWENEKIDQFYYHFIYELQKLNSGRINEQQFIRRIIKQLYRDSGVELKSWEFVRAWSAIKPEFDEFSSFLQEAVAYHCQPDREVIFIAFTNAREMAYLKDVLWKNHQDYKEVDGQLSEICGIPLYTTYTQQQSADKLFESIILKIHSRKPPQSAFAYSWVSGLGFKSPTPEEHIIKYIDYFADIDGYADFDVNNFTYSFMEEIAEQHAVSLVEWDKNFSPLADALNNNQGYYSEHGISAEALNSPETAGLVYNL